MTRRKHEHPELWHGGFGRVEVRHVHPYQADKEYICPGCGRPIPRGMGHRVAVPSQAPDLRRHWHHACWELETMRGRRRDDPRHVAAIGRTARGVAGAHDASDVNCDATNSNGRLDGVSSPLAASDARARLRSRRRQLR